MDILVFAFEALHCKTGYILLVNLWYVRFKLLKYRENNKKTGNTFDHNFKNIPLYKYYNEEGIISRFCIMRWCPYFKNFKIGA